MADFDHQHLLALLPTKVINKIVSYLSTNDLRHAKQVSKTWRTIFSNYHKNQEIEFMTMPDPVACAFFHGDLTLDEVVKLFLSDDSGDAILFNCPSNDIYPTQAFFQYSSVAPYVNQRLEKNQLQIAKCIKENDLMIILFSKIETLHYKTKYEERVRRKEKHLIFYPRQTLNPNFCARGPLSMIYQNELCHDTFCCTQPLMRKNPLSLYQLSKASVQKHFSIPYVEDVTD